MADRTASSCQPGVGWECRRCAHGCAWRGTAVVFRFSAGDSPAFLFPTTDGQLLCGSGSELHRIDAGGEIRCEEIIDTLATDMRFGVTDFQGRVWFGMTNAPTPARSGLYRYHNARLVQMLFDCPMPGGIAFPAGGERLAFANGTARQIRSHRLSSAGSLSRPQVVVDLSAEGRGPTALITDCDDMLWSAFANSPALVAYDAQGHKANELTMDVDEISGLTFGGAGLDEPLVTARSGTAEQLLDICRFGVKGLALPSARLGHGNLGLVDDDKHPH